MLQSKDIGWLIGLKNKIHLSAAYKRLTSELKTHTQIESEGMEKERYSMQIETKGKLGSNTHIRQSKF